MCILPLVAISKSPLRSRLTSKLNSVTSITNVACKDFLEMIHTNDDKWPIMMHRHACFTAGKNGRRAQNKWYNSEQSARSASDTYTASYKNEKSRSVGARPGNVETRRMKKSALENLTEGVLPLIREMVKEEVRNTGDGARGVEVNVKSELKIPFKDNFEIVLFMKRPALMEELRKRIERLEDGSPDQLAARLVDLVFSESYVATHEFSGEPFPCAKCDTDKNGAATTSTESVPVPFLNWLVGIVGERLSPNWVDSWRVCCDLRHEFCGPKARAEVAAGRLIKLERDLKRRESNRALLGN